MQSYEIFRQELRREESRILYQSPGFILRDDDEIYIAIRGGSKPRHDSLRIRVVHRQTGAPRWWQQLLQALGRKR